MKKIVSALVAVLMLSTVAFGAEYSITNQDFNRVADEITVNYSGHSGEFMTVFVYDVTSIAEASENTPWDVDNTPIIGLDQAVGEGSFNVKVKNDFTGKVVIVLGGEYGSSTKVLLNIVNGVPSIIDAQYDAGGDTAVVENEKSITIQKGNKLLNANVSTIGTGKVEYTNDANAVITLTGDMSFGNDGEIDALSGKTVEIVSMSADGQSYDKTVKLISNNADGQTYNVGYINRANVTADKTQYVVTLTSKDGKSAIEIFDLNSLEGEIRVRVGVENVPVGEEITQTVEIK